MVYNAAGTYAVTMAITDNGNTQSVTKQAYISSTAGTSAPLIEDFETGKDLIDLTAYGYDDIGDVTIVVSGGDSVLVFTAADDVTVLGVTGLNASDFVFA